MMLAILLVVGALLMIARRRRYETVEEEPWRASLAEDDEPLDMEQARRAEEEFLADSWQEDDDEPWRG
ncbi:MAG: hypothetical protein H0W11_14410 [Gemmatimonadetes bacterium]|nr:hypothetical protein [Gemmatimonadota bacterium]